MRKNAQFITEDYVPAHRTILSLVQQHDETVELVPRMAGTNTTYCLGIFEKGRLNLCPVAPDVLEMMGFDRDVSGRIIVGQH